MINAVVARRYAKGLLGAALEGGQDLTAIVTPLNELALLVAGHEQLSQLLASPGVERADKVAVLVQLADRVGANDMTKRFIEVLGQNDRLDHFRAAVKIFAGLADEHLGVVNAVITVPQPLDEAAVSDLKEKLAHATGSAVRIEVKTDPELLGGLTTRIGDVVYDGSLAYQLERMREQIAAS